MGRSRRRKGSSGYSSDSADSMQSELIDRKTGNYKVQETWHEGLQVQRGTAQRRLDMSHGFFVDILRNQTGRADYEDAWQLEKAKLEEVGDYRARPTAMQSFRGRRYDRQELRALASRSSSSSTSSDLSPPGFEAGSAMPTQRRRNTATRSPSRLQPRTSPSPQALASVPAQPVSRLAVSSIRAVTQASQARAGSTERSQQLMPSQPQMAATIKQKGSQTQPLPPPASLSDVNSIPVSSFTPHQPAERPVEARPQQQFRQHRQKAQRQPSAVQQPGQVSSANSVPLPRRPEAQHGDWEAAVADMAADPVTPAQLLHGAPAPGFVVGRPLIDGLVLGVPANIPGRTTGDWDSITATDLHEAAHSSSQAAPSVTHPHETSPAAEPKTRTVRVRQGHQTYQPPSAFQPAPAQQQKDQSAASPPERPATPLQQERSLQHSSPIVNDQPTWDVLLTAAGSLAPPQAGPPAQTHTPPAQQTRAVPHSQAAAPGRRRLSEVIADMAAVEAQPLHQQQQQPPAQHAQGWSDDAPAAPQIATWTVSRKGFATSYWSDCEDGAPTAARKQRNTASFAWCSTSKRSQQTTAAPHRQEPRPAQQQRSPPQPDPAPHQQRAVREARGQAVADPVSAMQSFEPPTQKADEQVSAPAEQPKGRRRHRKSTRAPAAGIVSDGAVTGDWLPAETDVAQVVSTERAGKVSASQPGMKSTARRKARPAAKTTACQPEAGSGVQVQPSMCHVRGDWLAAEDEVQQEALPISLHPMVLNTSAGPQRDAVVIPHRVHASRRPDAALYQPRAGGAVNTSA